MRFPTLLLQYTIANQHSNTPAHENRKENRAEPHLSDGASTNAFAHSIRQRHDRFEKPNIIVETCRAGHAGSEKPAAGLYVSL
jgi:hypothetical protein